MILGALGVFDWHRFLEGTAYVWIFGTVYTLVARAVACGHGGDIAGGE